jgi:predicted nucleic acid-binding protein
VTERVFLDTSVLIRYLSEDDPARAWAAAELIDGDRIIVLSGVVVLETVHALRTTLGHANPELAQAMVRLLSREDIELVDANKSHLIAALDRASAVSARRVADAIVAATAEQAGCDWIATFDEAFKSAGVPSRLL